MTDETATPAEAGETPQTEPSTPTEQRARNRLTIDLDGVPVVFRRAQMSDAIMVKGGLPEPPEVDDPDELGSKYSEMLKSSDDGVLAMLEASDRMLCRCAIAPRLLEELVADPGPGAICLPDIPETARLEAAGILMVESGIAPDDQRQASRSLDPSEPSPPGS